MRGCFKKSLTLGAAALLGSVVAAAPAAAITNTLVQFDPTGAGAYSIGSINSFDWEDTGSLVIESALVASSNGYTDLDSFFANASSGDTLSFKIHAQARLVSFSGGIDTSGMTLRTEADLGGDYEVTATLDAVETATYFDLGGIRQIVFTGIQGTFQYYLDTALLNADVATGVGFNDGDVGIGDPFLWGSVNGVSGSFGVNVFNTLGSFGTSNMDMSIAGYNSDVIETDPAAANVWLVGSTFQSQINLTSQIGLTNYLGSGLAVGSALDIGDAPYSFLRGVEIGGTLRGTNGDLILRGDASSVFTAVPEPGTMILLGSGLVGLAGVGRRRMKKVA